jgi:hypothetical protein
MSSILRPIQNLALLLQGLTSDTGDVIVRQFTATPDQPQPADFPAMIIEVDPGGEHSFQVHNLGGGHLVYTVNIMILVGVPSTTPVSELHDKAAAWVYPLGKRLVSDISLGGTVLMMGYGALDSGQEDVFKFHIDGMRWNQQELYALRATLPIKEDLTIPMG